MFSIVWYSSKRSYGPQTFVNGICTHCTPVDPPPILVILTLWNNMKKECKVRACCQIIDYFTGEPKCSSNKYMNTSLHIYIYSQWDIMICISNIWGRNHWAIQILTYGHRFFVCQTRYRMERGRDRTRRPSPFKVDHRISLLAEAINKATGRKTPAGEKD